jgi:acetyl-CoA carboxylase beta subunit
MELRVQRPESVNQSRRMLRLKACSRCGGDMIGGRDIYGEFDTCLQCGHTKDVVCHERIAVMFGNGRYNMGEVA